MTNQEKDPEIETERAQEEKTCGQDIWKIFITSNFCITFMKIVKIEHLILNMMNINKFDLFLKCAILRDLRCIFILIFPASNHQLWQLKQQDADIDILFQILLQIKM